MKRTTPSFSLDSLRSHFKVMRECPVCTNTFTEEHLRTVERREGSYVLHTTCEKCSHSLIFLVGSTQFGVGLVGLMSDLNFEDSVRFRQRQPITEDEMIECYQMLTRGHMFS